MGAVVPLVVPFFLDSAASPLPRDYFFATTGWIFHTDKRDRASFALDLMEAVRPAVDAYVLALLTQRTLAPRDFVEARDGGCRITPRLASELAGTTETWRHHVAPVVEWATHALIRHSTARLPLVTPLTRSNWKNARDERAPDRRTVSRSKAS